MWMKAVWLGQNTEPLAVGQGFILTACMLVLTFWNPSSLEGSLAQPRYGKEGLGPSSKQCALPS